MKSNLSPIKSKNFLNKKIIFRCDGGNINEISTGHVYRCLAIAKFFLKKKIRKKNMLFITKNKNFFKIGSDLIKNEGFKSYSPNRNNKLDKKLEIDTLNNFESELLIIDRLDNLKKNEILKLRKKHKKIILIDSSSKYIKFADLNLNPLIKNNYSNKNFGIRYLILPQHNTLNKKIIEKKIFLFFGGYDKKNILTKILNCLNKINFKLKVCIEKKHIKKLKNYKNLNFNLISKKNFLSNLKSSEFAIISGGLILFLCLKNSIPSISIPQYRHQKKNILRIAKYGATIMLENAENQQKLLSILSKFVNKNYINKSKKKINEKFSNKINENALLMILKLYDKKNIGTF